MRPDDRVGAGTMRVPLVWWWVGAGGRDFSRKASVAVTRGSGEISKCLSVNEHEDFETNTKMRLVDTNRTAHLVTTPWLPPIWPSVLIIRVAVRDSPRDMMAPVHCIY